MRQTPGLSGAMARRSSKTSAMRRALAYHGNRNSRPMRFRAYIRDYPRLLQTKSATTLGNHTTVGRRFWHHGLSG
jgi:hypothetical protein